MANLVGIGALASKGYVVIECNHTRLIITDSVQISEVEYMDSDYGLGVPSVRHP